MTQNNEFMQEAIEQARLSVVENKGGPFGAVVVKNNKVIGVGHNKVTTTNDPSAHAEIVAIRQACEKLGTFSLENCQIYTSCEPCPMCLAAIYWARIKNIFYAATANDAAKIDFDDAYIYDQLRKTQQERDLGCTQLMQKEAVEVFDLWAVWDSKVEY